MSFQYCVGAGSYLPSLSLSVIISHHDAHESIVDSHIFIPLSLDFSTIFDGLVGRRTRPHPTNFVVLHPLLGNQYLNIY